MDIWWHLVAYGVTQRALGALRPRRLMDGGIRHTVGCSSPQVDGDAGEHLGTSCAKRQVFDGVMNRTKRKKGVSMGLPFSAHVDSWSYP